LGVSALIALPFATATDLVLFANEATEFGTLPVAPGAVHVWAAAGLTTASRTPKTTAAVNMQPPELPVK
jgi:hypothetical protein